VVVVALETLAKIAWSDDEVRTPKEVYTFSGPPLSQLSACSSSGQTPFPRSPQQNLARSVKKRCSTLALPHIASFSAASE